MANSLFTLRGELSNQQRLILSIVGLFVILGIWTGVAYMKSDWKKIIEAETDYSKYSNLPEAERDSIIALLDAQYDEAYANATDSVRVFPILPPPGQVVATIPDLINKDELKINTFKSVWINLKGYLWAILIAIPLGFLIGLLPIFRGMFNRPVDAIRYLPLTALTGLFMSWYGISDAMKVAFLAFGILVYLLPVVVQRIDEVKDVYLKTVFTLGANGWQTIRTVYFPSVMSRISDDIRVLTAISWTYIIVAELVNSAEGGIGALIYLKARQAQLAKVFAILLVIVLIGFIQDKYFRYLDKQFFPFKDQNSSKKEESILSTFINFALLVVSGLYVLLSIWPKGREIIRSDNVLGDGFYVFLFVALIQLILELFRFLSARKQSQISELNG
ncbi:MAG: ABC transporter permease subunit [Bacteroidota bacterium]